MLNFYIDNNTFPNELKKADITNCRAISILLFYLKLLNAAYKIKFINILIPNYPMFSVAFEKVLVRNIH